jgi:hypothetical protein
MNAEFRIASADKLHETAEFHPKMQYLSVSAVDGDDVNLEERNTPASSKAPGARAPTHNPAVILRLTESLLTIGQLRLTR